MQAVHDRMPGPPPPESDTKRHRYWRERLQHALVGALASVHESFACNGEPAGCTATVVLQVSSPQPGCYAKGPALAFQPCAEAVNWEGLLGQ